jgi:hypothetical protein
VPLGVARSEQPLAALACGVIEAFVGHDQQPPGAPQRLRLAAAVPQRLVLDPAADLVKPLVGGPDHVEGVGDLLSVGQHRVRHRPVGPGQVQGDPLDPVPPALGTRGEPSACRSGVTALYDVQQLVSPTSCVDHSRCL